MAICTLYSRIEFPKRFIKASRDEKRVVTKSKLTTDLISNVASDNTFEKVPRGVG